MMGMGLMREAGGGAEEAEMRERGRPHPGCPPGTRALPSVPHSPALLYPVLPCPALTSNVYVPERQGQGILQRKRQAKLWNYL